MADEKQRDEKAREKDCGCKKSPVKGDRGNGEDPCRKGPIPWCRLINQQGRKYTPWLMIPYNTTDVGLRPLPPNTAYYVSPYIYVESSDPSGNIVAGEPNYVHAIVINAGMAPAFPTIVDFYWGNPSLGLGAASMHWIGTEWVYIWQGSQKDVRCNTPWVPDFENGGHECIIVNCSAPINDPITDPFEPWLDRHVGQRNVMVTEATAGELINLPLAVHNLFPIVAQTEFHARIEHFALAEGKGARGASKREIINELANFGQERMNTAEELVSRYAEDTAEARLAALIAPVVTTDRPEPIVRRVDPVGRARVTAKFSGNLRRLKTGNTLGAVGQLFAATDTLKKTDRTVDNTGNLLLQTASLQPNEHRTLEVELEVPAATAQGEFMVAHIIQAFEGVPIGGYTIVVSVGKGWLAKG
jgi:hypothetical protein